MGSWPTESHLVPRKSGCAKETIENTDAVKIKKRVKALESIIKHTDFPWLTLEVSAHPIAPNPRDLTITKRQWEKAAMKYRHELIALRKRIDAELEKELKSPTEHHLL